MLGILYALVTVLSWGTWLAPSQTIAFRNQQIKTFYVGVANLLLAGLVYLFLGAGPLSWAVFWPPFGGGLVWSVSGLLAFTATYRIGMARAFGIWAPINVAISMLWGVLIFGEFANLSSLTLALLAGALVVTISGVLLIIFARGSGGQATTKLAFWTGLLSAVGAGILWGSYYLPIKMSTVSTWEAAFPLALGIFTGSLLLAGFTRQPLRLEKPAHYLRVIATGLLWGIGNYGMLLLVEQLGAGKGFTISQLSVVVNGLVGIYWLKDPPPRSRAAALTLAGCVLATLGGIFLGTLK